jgi:hypothetical protein
MAQAASIAARRMVEFLASQQNGVNANVAQLATNAGIALAPVTPSHIVNQNVAFEMAERSQAVKYPAVQVYVDRVRNTLNEKFRTFSGKVRTVAEVRMSQDRLEGIEDQLRLYVDAVTQVLDANRGNWGEGMFFAGGYEVAFDPVKRGGKNFLQIAKVTFEVDLSV